MREKKINTKLRRFLQVVWLVYAVLSISILLPKADDLLCKDYQEVSKHVLLDKHWDIEIDNQVYTDVSLNDFKFLAVEKGDIVIMQRQLPKDWDMVEAALRLHIRHSAVKIYIQGEQVYEWNHAYRAFLTENRLPMFLGSFFVIFGVSALMITVIALLFSRKYVRMLCLAAFSICIGLWTLCYYNVVLIYSIPLYSVSFVEYMALYMAPIPLIVYMYHYVKVLNSKTFKIAYWILFTIQFIFNVITIYLHTIDKVHCAATLKYLQILIVVNLIYFAIVIIKNIRYGHFNSKWYMFGLLIVVGCIGYDLLSYCNNRYYAGTMDIKGVSGVGIMLFLYILLLEFYHSISKKLMEETERNFLIKSAYTDDLTQLPN